MQSAPLSGTRLIRAGYLASNDNTESRPVRIPVTQAWRPMQNAIVQLSGSGFSTFVTLLLQGFQKEAPGPAAYICGWSDRMFPPDLARNGVDLNRLLIVIPENPAECIRAVDTVIRSGQFGLVIFEAPLHPRISLGMMGRLAHIVRHYAATLIIATEEDQPLLASAVKVHGIVRTEETTEGVRRISLSVHRDRLSLPTIYEDVHDQRSLCSYSGLVASDRRP